MSELLKSFGDLLDQYAQHREYIAKAQSQAEKFSSSVIEKVVLDHEMKASSVADGILPLVPDLEAAIEKLDADVAAINEDKAGAEQQYQELELRNAIGELDGTGFEDESSELKARLADADSRLEALNEERSAHTDSLARWVELAGSAGQDAGTRSAEQATATVDQVELADEPAADAVAEAEVSLDDDEIEVSLDDGEIGLELDEPDAEDSEEVELDLDGAGEAGEESGDEIGIDLDEAEEPEAEAAPASDDAPAEESEDSRRALLLYQEGTADERIYPFTGDVLSVGRGRDNDIQIKNDSKVSRFHCKLFRRNGNFYIEDNKSSNGTLVNGELITERRLFGGEEVIIGETFFSFRIM